jgi:AraC-like DNA-binding protein
MARWTWDAAAMAAAPAQANSALHSIYMERCRTLAQASDRRDELIERIEALMATSDGEEWTLERIARRLSLSTRSLQRHLSARGLNFRSIMDDNRQRIGKRLLLETDLSIAEIAWNVGYADPSCFYHAFVRWTGRPPGIFRAATDREVVAATRTLSSSVVTPGTVPLPSDFAIEAPCFGSGKR